MFHYTKAILRVGGRILATYFFKLKKWAKHLDKYPRELRYSKMRNLVQHISNALSIDLHVFGLENVPTDENYLLVCNHMSAYDPLAFISILEKPVAFVSKMELMKAPFVPTALKVLESEPIDRDDLRQSLGVMLNVEDSLRKHEKNWMIFPEGTRIHDQLLPVGDFHHGTFRPAVKSGALILPAAIYGTFRVFSKKPQFKKYPVCVSFLKPMTPEEYKGLPTCDVAKKMQQVIQKEITYHLRPLDHKLMSESKDTKYKYTQVL